MATQETKTVEHNDPARILIRLSAVLTLIMAVAAGVLIWRSRNDTSTPVGESDNSVASTDGDMPDIVADFELTERSGRKVTNKDLLGNPWAVCFVFTNCAGPCPRVTGQMKLLQNRFVGKPVRLVTITVDPKRDTAERLANYADNFGADEQQWLFLTGDQDVIYPLIGNSFGLTVHEETGPMRKKGWEITHSTRVVHVDAAGHIRGKYDAGNDAEMAELARQLQKEIEALPPGTSLNPTVDETGSPVEAPVPTAASQPTPNSEGT